MAARKREKAKPKTDKKSPTARKIRGERVQARLAERPGWQLAGEGAIRRTYRFPSFRAAIRFVDWVAELAEAHDHHPDIDVRFDRVTLTLRTHSAGGLTARDFALADLVDHR